MYGVSDIALYILGNWKNNLEDWAAEDWNEDVSGLNSLPILFYIHDSKRIFILYIHARYTTPFLGQLD